jgi:outer membrane lipoprotein-sorting protein
VTGEAKTAFLKAWGERLQAMRSLHMVFTQEKHLRVLRRPLVARGELWLKGETLLYVLKNAAGETELELRVDKQAVKTHYPLLKTLEVINLHTTTALPLSMPFLTPEPDILHKEYDVELFHASGLYTLRLVPKDPKAPLQEMRLVLQEFQPQELTQVEKNGTRVTMHISAFTVNPEVSEAQLELHIPPGTKVTTPLK